MSRLRRHPENHLVERIGWLRAAVLGANDGIVSTASLIVGVAAAAATRNDVLIAGVAGLVSSREVWRNGATERILRFNRPTAVRRFSREARGYWRFQRGKIQRRMLVSEGLADRDELKSNILRIVEN